MTTEKEAAPEEQTNDAAEDNNEAEDNNQETNEEGDAESTVEGGESSETDVAPKEEGDKKHKNPIPKWAADRIAKEKSKATEAQKLNAELLEKIAALQKGESVDDKPNQEQVANLTKEQIETRAKQLVAEREFYKNINSVIEAGRKEYSDFDQVTATLNDALGDTFLEARPLLVELPNAHKVIQYLGNEPEEAIRIFSLSPVKQIMELSKLSDKIEKPKEKQVTKVPDPITTVSGRTKATVTSATAKTTEEFVAARQRELKAAGKTNLL